MGRPHKVTPGVGIRPRSSGLRVQGTANSPSSTARFDYTGREHPFRERLQSKPQSVRLVQGHPVAPICFAPIHQPVSSFHQGFGGIVRLRHRATQGYRCANKPAVLTNAGLFHQVAQFFTDQCQMRPIHIQQEDRELFSTPAADQVKRGPDGVGYCLGYHFQYFVPDLMPQVVVDSLEAIDISKQQAERNLVVSQIL